MIVKGRIPRPLMVSKEEIKEHEIQKSSKEYIDDTHLLACPRHNFFTVSTKTCSSCPYFKGIAPANRDKPISHTNLWIICQHPIGRLVMPLGHEREGEI